MCYRNCIHENYHGECTKGGFSKGYICPGDREECTECHGIFDESDLENGLCESCIAEQSKIKRYAFISIPGGFNEFEKENGEWVKYEDVKELIERKEAI